MNQLASEMNAIWTDAAFHTASGLGGLIGERRGVWWRASSLMGPVTYSCSRRVIGSGRLMPGMGRAMVSRGVRRSALCCFFGPVAGLSLCERTVSLPIISTYRTMRRHQNFILADKKRLEFDGLQPVKVFYLFFFLTDCLATCWIHHQLPFIIYFILFYFYFRNKQART